MVDWRAHPDILSQPILFWNATFGKISFATKDNPFPSNKITLKPTQRWASVEITTGDYAFGGVPTNYTSYNVYFNGNKNVSSAELAQLFQWTNATNLAIVDNNVQHEISLRLMERIDEMSVLTNLATLKFEINKTTHKLLNIRPFLEKLPSLQVIMIRPYFVSNEQFKSFVARQQLPDNWSSEISIFQGAYRVHFFKKANN